MRILVPVDGSDTTQRTLTFLAAHDGWLPAAHELTFFTVVPPIPAWPARALDRDTLDAHYRDAAERVLAPVRADADRQGWTYRLAQAHGQPAAEIVRAAEAGGHEVIVMGSHGHTALANVLLGSVATGVLARCRLPVLLIR